MYIYIYIYKYVDIDLDAYMYIHMYREKGESGTGGGSQELGVRNQSQEPNRGESGTSTEPVRNQVSGITARNQHGASQEGVGFRV